MSIGNWLFGWLLVGIMVGVGIIHGWPLVWGGGLLFGVVWWFLPDILDHDHQDPPEDIR